MLCRELIQKIEEIYPESAAMDWDNTGFLVGRKEREVSCVYVTVDLDERAVRDAKACGADMIITHHPLIFSPLRSVTDRDFIGRRVTELLRSDICCYAMHTNYDILRMAELAAELLGLRDSEVLAETGENGGIGRIGTFGETVTVRACCERVKAAFGLDCVRVFGDPDRTVRRIAVSPGSGKSVIGDAAAKGAEVLVTGDIDHHAGIDAEAQGLTVVDAGHYGLEHIFTEDMGRFLKEHIPQIRVECAKTRHPFQTI